MRGAGDQHSAENSSWGNSWWPWKTGQVIFTSLYRGLLFYTCVWALLTPPTFNGIIWDFFFCPQSQNGCGQSQGIHMEGASQTLAEDRQWQLGNNKVHCTCVTLKGCAHLRSGKFKDQIVEVTWHAEVSASPLEGVMWDHIHQPTFTMVESTCERKHGFWRIPQNTRCSSGLCRTSQFWMDWVLVHIHQGWRWE